MKNILLTGSTGFIGRSLRTVCKDVNWITFESDLRNATDVETELGKHNFDMVFHLAAISDVGTCRLNPVKAMKVNWMGTVNLALGLAEKKPKVPLVFFSTGQVYGKSENGILTEDCECDPQNEYSYFKWLAEQSLLKIPVSVLEKVIILRMFNHSHKTQDNRFFLPGVYNQIRANMGKSSQVTLEVGNLELERDIGSIFDLANACRKIMDCHESFENRAIFNLSSGSAYSLKTLVELLGKEMGLKLDIQVKSEKIRQGEQVRILGNSLKLQRATGWAPSVRDPQNLVKDFLKDLNDTV
jgi:nucleoside-diphosphate-sugar epimerase